MSKTIIAVVGLSGCGKTTMTQHIEKELDIPAIVSYTTRPMREGETNGVEHWFVDKSEMPPIPSMLAYAYFGGHHYWTTHDQIPENKACTYIIDEHALQQMIYSFGAQYKIIPVYVFRSAEDLSEIDENRRNRDLERPMIDSSIYVATIENKGTLGAFLKESVRIFKTLI